MEKRRSILRLIWGITAPIFPFLVFFLLGIAGIENLVQRVTITFTVTFVWIFVLVIAYVLDWEEKRLSQILQSTESDCIISLWETTVNVQNDGSTMSRRMIEGISNTDERRYFELPVYSDLQEAPAIKPRFARVTADVRTGATLLNRVLDDKQLLPASSAILRHDNYIIPLSKVGELPLRRGDSFIIKIEEELPVGTWKKEGDYYSHRVTHVTQKLAMRVDLPTQWTVAEAYLEVKSPTAGVWTGMPNVRVDKGQGKRTHLAAIIPNPKLLHTYRLGFRCVES